MHHFSAVLLGLTAVLLVGAASTHAQVFKPHFWGRAGGMDGSLGSDAGEFFDPEKLTVDAVGNVWVADVLNHRIQKFDGGGDFQAAIGSFGTGPGQFNSPRGVAVDPGTGNLYVVDSVNDRVQVFSPDGSFVQQWGSTGTGPGQFRFPHGIAVDAAGGINVTDGDNHRVQRFSAPGTFDVEWGSFGGGDGQFQFPRGICADPDSGGVYVVDSFNHRIQRFLADGTLIEKLGRNGGDGSFGSEVGELNTPRDVAVDSNGPVVIADTGNDRLSVVFSGTWYTTGEFGVGPEGLNTPRGLAVYTGGRYVADSGNHRVALLGSQPPLTARAQARRAERDDRTLPLEVNLVPLGGDPTDLTAIIRYQLPETSDVALELWDAEGRFVRTLDRSTRAAGVQTLEWRGAVPTQHVRLRATGPSGERIASTR